MWRDGVCYGGFLSSLWRDAQRSETCTGASRWGARAATDTIGSGSSFATTSTTALTPRAH